MADWTRHKALCQRTIGISRWDPETHNVWCEIQEVLWLHKMEVSNRLLWYPKYTDSEYQLENISAWALREHENGIPSPTDCSFIWCEWSECSNGTPNFLLWYMECTQATHQSMMDTLAQDAHIDYLGWAIMLDGVHRVGIDCHEHSDQERLSTIMWIWGLAWPWIFLYIALQQRESYRYNKVTYFQEHWRFLHGLRLYRAVVGGLF